MDIADVWGWLLRGESGDAEPDRQLEAVLTLVADVVACAVASSITELDGGTYGTVAASSSLALELDLAQYAGGDGPCMTAARDRQLLLVRDTGTAARFSAFGTVAQRLGVHSSLSVPISTASHPAALNIYATGSDAFTERDRTVAEFFGRTLSRRLVGTAGERPMTETELAAVQRRRALVAAAQERIARRPRPISLRRTRSPNWRAGRGPSGAASSTSPVT